MLDESGEKRQRAIELIDAMPCRVEPPGGSQEDARRGAPGYLDTDRRRSQRVACRRQNLRAGIQTLPTFPALVRDLEWQAAPLIDISLHGMGFFYGQPLYPLERLNVLLPNGPTVEVEVRSCVRLKTHCFQIGVKIVESPDATPQP